MEKKVGPNFKFSLKLPQFITHRKNINDVEAYQKIDEFLLLWSEIKDYSGVNFAVMANYFRSEQFNELDKFIDLIKYTSDRKGHDKRYAIDSTLLKKELHWQPRETFDTGIKKTIEWYLNNMDWVNKTSKN